jgi:hypothetical protein
MDAIVREHKFGDAFPIGGRLLGVFTVGKNVLKQ